ncbi:hypothetical protein M3Y98_00859500 [Aphelenchoides besseyi]|nr:hypothetical protein M3Y98_00859500 [Aphelenchoides besseyi]
MAQLTSSQYSAIMSKATMLILKMGPTKVTGALNSVLTVLGNNLGPFYTQLNAFSKSMQTRGLKPAACWKEQFRLVNSASQQINRLISKVLVLNIETCEYDLHSCVPAILEERLADVQLFALIVFTLLQVWTLVFPMNIFNSTNDQ